MSFEKLRRLRQMTGAEMQFRLAQRWRIQKEQWGLSAGDAATPWATHWDSAAVRTPQLRERLQSGEIDAAADLLPSYFAGRKIPAFYFDPQQRNQILAAHAAAFPQREGTLRAEADAICAHRFRIFAYPEVSAGPAIPWQRDMVRGGQARAEHWARVPYLDFARAGDSKIVWEPNRHQHFVTLGQAYFLTGEERYAEECAAQWDNWLRANPRGIGINWASSLELAFRLWSWCWALHFLQGSAALSGERLAAICKSIWQHAEFIRENLSTYFSPNTHLLGEGFALFVVGLLFPELRDAAAWRQTGRAVLTEQMAQQVRADGWHVEQSSYYHRYAVDFFQCAAILAERNGAPFPAAYRAKLARMYEVILHTQLPCGSQPMLGDADGGRLLPFAAPPAPSESHDQRDALCTGALFFQRDDLRGAVERLHEESFWLLGHDTVSAGNAKAPARLPRASKHFREAGCVVLRDDAAESGSMLLLDAGPQGLAGCAHGHADALSVVCSALGQDWLIDPGTFVYTGSREWRHAFSSTRAHNTVVVDGRDQAEPVDIFKWRKLPAPRLEKWLTSPGLDVAVASHDGYLRLPQGVQHRRRVVFVKPRYWLIRDELTGRGHHQAEVLFHFAPGTKLAVQGQQCTAVREAQNFLLACSAAPQKWEIIEGDETRRIGWYSAEYGQRVAAPVACATWQFTDSLCVDWLLFPGARASDYHVSGSGDETVVRGSGEETRLLHRAAVAGSGSLTSDGEFLLRVLDAQQKTVRLALFNGCCVQENDLPLLQADSMLDAFDATVREATLHIHARPLRRLRYFAPGIQSVVCNGQPAQFAPKGDWIEVSPA